MLKYIQIFLASKDIGIFPAKIKTKQGFNNFDNK